MKKTFLLVLCYSAITAFAQNGFFLQPEVGVGMSNIIQKHFSYAKQHSIITFNPAIDIGYQFHNWRFQSGIEYLKTGYELDHATYMANFGDWLNGKVVINYEHILVPVKLSYKIKLNKKWSFYPSAGAYFSYNYRFTMKAFDAPVLNTSHFNRYSCFATAGLNIECQLTQRLALSISPVCDYMLSSIYKESEMKFNSYAVLLQGGIVWHFKKKQKSRNSIQ